MGGPVPKSNAVGINWPTVFIGGLASLFVGTLYGFSYLKDDIEEFWTLEAENPDAVKAQIAMGKDFGFLGQYLAIIPGLIFDNFGASVTCVYGGALACMGFSGLVATAVRHGYESVGKSWMLPIGLFFVGQGSKGLGFGTLLGTVKACESCYSSAISGTFLMLDAASSVMVMLVYDNIWKATTQSHLDPKEDDMLKADSDQMFFVLLGVVVLIISLFAGIAYFIVLKDDDIKPKEESESTNLKREDLQLLPPGRSSNSRRLSTASGGKLSISSLNEEANLNSFRAMNEGNDSFDDEDEEVLAVVRGTKAEEAGPSSIPWFSVLCVYAVLLTGEAAGLAFNGAIGDSFKGFRRHAFFMTTGNLKSDNFGSYFQDDLSFAGQLVSNRCKDSSDADVVQEHRLQCLKAKIDNTKAKTLCNCVDEHNEKHGESLAPIEEALKKLSENLPKKVMLMPKNSNKFTVEGEDSQPNAAFLFTSDEILPYTYRVVLPSEVDADVGNPDALVLISKAADKSVHKDITVRDLDVWTLGSATLPQFLDLANKVFGRDSAYDFAPTNIGQALKEALTVLHPAKALLHEPTPGQSPDAEVKTVEVQLLSHTASVVFNVKDGAFSHESPKEINTAAAKKQAKLNSAFLNEFKVLEFAALPTPGSALALKPKQFTVEGPPVNKPDVIPEGEEDEETSPQRVKFQKMFGEGTQNYQSLSARGNKKGLTDLAYPMYSDAITKKMKEGKQTAYSKWTRAWEISGDGKAAKMAFQPLNGDDKKCVPGSEGFTVEVEEEEPFVYDIAAQKRNAKNMADTNRTLTMIYALSNAAGRLSIGFMAEPFNKALGAYGSLSFWFVWGPMANVFIYSIFSFMHPGGCTDPKDIKLGADESSSGRYQAPFFLYFMTFMAAFSYGGVFTINTSYLKSIVPANKSGVILGASLVVLAIGNMALGKLPILLLTPELSHKEEHAGEKWKTPDFLLYLGVSVFALIPGFMVYCADVATAKKNDEGKFEGDESDETSEES